MDEPYRPCNGDEARSFMQQWCARCQKDAEYDDGLIGAGCTIAAMALGHYEDHPNYPKEWVYDGDRPVCTAFAPGDL